MDLPDLIQEGLIKAANVFYTICSATKMHYVLRIAVESETGQKQGELFLFSFIVKTEKDKLLAQDVQDFIQGRFKGEGGSFEETTWNGKR